MKPRGKNKHYGRDILDIGAVTGVPAVGLQNIISDLSRRYSEQQQLCEEGVCRHEQDRQQVMGLAPPATDAASTCTVIKNQQLKHSMRQFCWRKCPVFRIQGHNLMSSIGRIQQLETI